MYDLEEWCEEIDAAMFSGDAFLEKVNRDLLEKYMARWKRGLKEQKKLAKELAAMPEEKPDEFGRTSVW